MTTATPPAPKKLEKQEKIEKKFNIAEHFKERAGLTLVINELSKSWNNGVEAYRVNYIDKNHPKYNNFVADSFFVLFQDGQLSITNEKNVTINQEKNKLLED